jgi:hypothetical protein
MKISLKINEFFARKRDITSFRVRPLQRQEKWRSRRRQCGGKQDRGTYVNNGLEPDVHKIADIF